MDRTSFNAFCSSLPQTTHVILWGGADVWKIGGKVFAIGWQMDDTCAITFKVPKDVFGHLQNIPGLRPAPYLASRGMTWIQYYIKASVSDQELQEFIRDSYDLIKAKLPKRVLAELDA